MVAVPLAGDGEAVPPPLVDEAQDASAMMPSAQTKDPAEEATVAMSDSG
jgi:hypothetical protein